MKNNLSSRDFAKLSAYLDGELNASASRKMKTRLARDPNLRAALDDLRVTKNILQRTPKRRSPRNFTLSPQMVSQSPPMPRLVSVLNYATAFAMLLFFFSILFPFSVGGGRTLSSTPEMMMKSANMAVTEAPAQEAEPMPMAEAPTIEETTDDIAGAVASEESPSRDMAEGEKTATDEQLVEATLSSSATLVATPYEEEQETFATPSFTSRQEILLIAMVLFAISGAILRRSAITKWQNKP